MDLYKRSKLTGLCTKCIQERTWHRTRNSKPSPTQSGAKTYWRVRTGRTEAGNASYETFGEDKAAAEAFTAKLNDRAKAKRLGELDSMTKEEANDWNWLRYLKHKGANLDGYKAKGEKTSDPLRRLTYRTRKYRESIRANGKPIPEIVATLEYEAGNGKKEIKAKNQNIMRHSFISYHMKLYNNAGLTSAIAGNSERQVEGTYLEMVEDQRDAKLWFCINPPEIVNETASDGNRMTTDEAFDLYLKIKFMAPNTSLSNEIAETHDQMLSELTLWENEINEETGELNMHSLAKKKEWFDDPTVKWVDGQPMIKTVNLTS